MISQYTVRILVYALASASICNAQSRQMEENVKVTKASHKFDRVDTEKYSFEIPSKWLVGKETPWKARDIAQDGGAGHLGAMTAGPTKQGWDELFKTSLFFIKREEEGTETPFRTGKTKLGYDCMRFEVKNKAGFTDRRYTLIRNASGNVLALSIKIPTPDQEKSFVAIFEHMVDTAKVK